MSDIVLRIDRLVLEGVDLSASGSRVLRASVEAELTRLLSKGAIAPALMTGATASTLVAPSVRLQPGAQPAAIGRQIAGAVYRGIGK